jgi:phenylpropionate dioxygenase-like ring-hydroxylating dioxygenase large terminal subunit
METGQVSLDVYTSKERFELEKEIFGRVWLNIAETSEIPNPGDWIVRDVAVRLVSAIIVRGKDMKIPAFHNICSHRGMKLVWDKKRRGGTFSCPYHAWYSSASRRCCASTLQQYPKLSPMIWIAQ